MANCISLDNPKIIAAHRSLANKFSQYVSMKEALNISRNILSKNKGNPLSLNPDGSISTSLKSLLNLYSREEALFLRVNMFSDSFTAKYGEWHNQKGEPKVSYMTPGIKAQTTGNGAIAYGNGSLDDVEISKDKSLQNDDNVRKCIGIAEKGARIRFSKGHMWKIEEDFFNVPTHKEGGTDILVGSGKISFVRGETIIKAENGLLASTPESIMQFQDNWLTSIYDNKIDKGASNKIDYTVEGSWLGQINLASQLGMGLYKNSISNYSEANDAPEMAAKLPEVPPINGIAAENMAYAKEAAKVNAVSFRETNNTYRLIYTQKYNKKGAVNSQTSCRVDGCAAFVEQELYNNLKDSLPDGYDFTKFIHRIGLHGNAWQIGGNLKKQGGKQIDFKSSSIGDIVIMNTSSTKWSKTAKRDGDGYTHVGIVDGVGDGYMWILHSYGGKAYRQKYNYKDKKIEGHSFYPGYVVKPNYAQL